MNNEYEYSYLNEAGIANVIPSHSTYSEDALYTIASVEESYTNVMKTIGVVELDAVMEAEGFSFKKLWEKFKNFVKDLWEKFVELVKTARDRITYFVINKFKFFKDKKLTPANIVKAVEKDFKKDSVKATNRWKKYAGAYYEYDEKFGKDMVKYIDNAMKNITSYAKKLKSSSDIDKMNDKTKAIVADMLKDCLEVSAAKIAGMSNQEIKDQVNKLICKEVNITEPGKFVITNAAQMWKNLDGAKERFDKDVKTPYKNCKSNLDKAIKDAKRVVDTKEFKPFFSTVSAGTKCYSMLVGCMEQAHIKSIVWQFKLMYAAAGLVGVSESATFESEFNMDGQSTTFQTELSSLWDF